MNYGSSWFWHLLCVMGIRHFEWVLVTYCWPNTTWHSLLILRMYDGICMIHGLPMPIYCLAFIIHCAVLLLFVFFFFCVSNLDRCLIDLRVQYMAVTMRSPWFIRQCLVYTSYWVYLLCIRYYAWPWCFVIRSCQPLHQDCVKKQKRGKQTNKQRSASIYELVCVVHSVSFRIYDPCIRLNYLWCMLYVMLCTIFECDSCFFVYVVLASTSTLQFIVFCVGVYCVLTNIYT